MYLPYVIKFNAKDPVAASRYAEIARFVGLSGASEQALINSLCDKINDFNVYDDGNRLVSSTDALGNTTIYSYDPCKNAWTVAGQNSIGIATAPAVKVMGPVFIISGETHPGVRTPVISTLNHSK